MTDRPDRSELSRRAAAASRRVAEHLQRQQEDLVKKMPDEARGDDVLGRAARAAERVARLLEASRGDCCPDPNP